MAQFVLPKFKLSDLKSVYLILGTEEYLAAQIREQLKTLLPADTQTMNFASYDMEQTGLDVLIDDATSAPFFGDHRIILVEHPFFLTGDTTRRKIEQDPDLLQTYLAQPVETTHLFIFAPYEKLDGRKKVVKTLQKTAETINVAPLDERQAKAYVAKALANDEYEIQPAAMEQLMQKTEGNLSEMMGQLPKLKLYDLQNKVIDTHAVVNLVSPNMNESVFSLVEAVLNKNLSQAMQLYEALLLQNEEPIKLNALLLSQFRLLIQVKILLQQNFSQGELAGRLKAHPYRVKLAIQRAKTYRLPDLKDAYLGLEKVERTLKTGTMDRLLTFQLFVLHFTQRT